MNQIWVKYGDSQAVRIRCSSDEIVDDLKRAVKSDLQLSAPLQNITLSTSSAPAPDGSVSLSILDADISVSTLVSSFKNPLIVQATKAESSIAPFRPWMLHMLQDVFFDVPTSSQSDFSQKQFKKDVLSYYGLSNREGLIKCQLLDVELPSQIAIASHLFRKSKAKYLPDLLGLEDVNEARNGLILFKCIEHEFDNFGLCFVKEDGQYKMKILNPKLLTTTFEDHLTNLNPRLSKLLPVELRPKRFGDYLDRALVFRNASRLPYARCLNFQARTAQAYAIQQGWKKDGEFVFDDFWSNEDLVDKVGILDWLAGVDIHGSSSTIDSLE